MVYYLCQLAEIKHVSIPRYIFSNIDVIITNIDLHGFCDSSNQAYCAVVYAQVATSSGCVSRIVSAKTKVAPIEQLSIPRLELLSCLLLTELMQSISRLLNDTVKIDKKYYWSDSMVALAWIKAKEKIREPWVHNRVGKIKEMSKGDDWYYVNTGINPADIGTRESSALKIVSNDAWWCGPSFLTKKVVPKNVPEDPMSDITDVDNTSILTVDSTTVGNISEVIGIEKYSTLHKLLRVSAYVIRFIHNCKGKNKEARRTGEITYKEIVEVTKLWLLADQSSLGMENNFLNLKKQLSLFTDAEGIVRLKGRLENSHLTYEEKHPILLNRSTYLTKLLILQAHEKVKHMRMKSTLNELRSHYWCPKGRQMVKMVLKSCVVCRYVTGSPSSGPPPPNLPDFRVSYEFAYMNIGIKCLNCKGSTSSFKLSL